MTSRIATTVAAVLLAVSVDAGAEDPLAAEALAQPQSGDSVELELESIRRFGEKTVRLEIMIRWGDPTRPAPEGYTPRKVRYMGDCEEGTLTLAAVGVFDASGRPLKSVIVPPRASDPIKPEKGTDLAKWLRQACMW